MALTNFGEQFAGEVLTKMHQDAVTPAISNTDYEGEIKKPGDRVNILSFLNDISLGDYVVGTDMATETIVDSEEQLVVEKRKFYNFPMDRLEELFTYGQNVTGSLIDLSAKALEKDVDTFVLAKAGDAKAGSWVGVNVRVAGSGAAIGTMASVATTATGGTITLQVGQNTQLGGSPVEQGDGTLAFSGFTSADLGKPIRLTSGTSWATEWYTITGVTDTNTATITNWDSAIAGSDIPAGDILRGLAGGEEYTSSQNGDEKPTTSLGWGWEFQAAFATAMSSSNIYGALVDTAQKLDSQEVPDTDRHLTVPSQAIALLRQASQLQPAISMAYEGVVINGRVGRVLAFDIHNAVGARVSMRAGHATAAGVDTDAVLTAGTQGFQMLANHMSYVTFAQKWSESRVVDQINQFAKNYQGLLLYGAKVPAMRRRSGAVLFGSF